MNTPYFSSLLLLISLGLNGPALSFTLNTSNGAAFKQKTITLWVTSNSTCSEIGVSNEELLSEAVLGANVFWNQVVTADLTIDRGGIYQTSDLRFIQGKVCPNDECPEDEGVDRTIENIIIACNDNSEVFPSANMLAVSSPLNVNGTTILGSIILLNNTVGSSLIELTSQERVTVLAHEIGHALGIGHSPLDFALMYSSYIPGQTKLSNDDRDALSYLYPRKFNGCFASLDDISKNSRRDQEINPWKMTGIALSSIIFIIMTLFWKLISSLILVPILKKRQR